MKKFLAVTAAAVLALSVGCSKEEEKPKEEAKPAAEVKKEDGNAEKITLLNFEGELVNQLRGYHAPFNAYAAGLEKEGEEALPQAELDKLKADAKASGEKAVAEIPSIEVPSDLTKEHQESVKASLEELKKSYEARVAGLEDEAKATEADELFTAFEEKLNTVHEDLKMIPGKFASEL
ncbi:hypothetical protein [Fictibacillus sp. JL2B1089]|uniref:hypothetical protein n=1 Tax=Fictibacillus sp. JL2B1089 TaxID=3399565 RepID=UPI003A887714